MLFKDNFLYNQFCDDGFVILQIFNDREVEALNQLYDKNINPPENGLLPSLRYGSNIDKIAEFEQIKTIIDNAQRRHFDDFDYVANHFITKTANNPNEFRLHQDWNVTDESKYIAAHIWSPLHEINEANGGLFMVKGSHKFFKNYRSGSLGIPFVDSTEDVKKHIVSPILKPGQAIIYNQSLFHGSYPNSTKYDRKVVLSCIKPKEAPMLYYHKEALLMGQTHIKIYAITPELLLEQITDLEKGEVPKNATLYSDFSDSTTPNNLINNSIFEDHLQRAEKL